jgi:pimeloyl-ACP methyl ester carboxylesterase
VGNPISSTIQQKRKKIIPDAAHFVHVEQTDAFNDVLLALLGNSRQADGFDG